MPQPWLPPVLLFLLGLAVRWPGHWPFWFDEVYTAQFATFPMSLPHLLQRLAAEDAHPPLGYLLLKAWALLAGLRDPLTAPPPGVEWGLRLPARCRRCRRWRCTPTWRPATTP